MEDKSTDELIELQKILVNSMKTNTKAMRDSQGILFAIQSLGCDIKMVSNLLIILIQNQQQENSKSQSTRKN